MRFHFHPGARRDFKEGYSWYLERSDRAAFGFIDEVSATLDKISGVPQSFRPISKQSQARIIRVNCYPFSIVFLPSASRIVIIAVAHYKRHPEYWRRRL